MGETLGDAVKRKQKTTANGATTLSIKPPPPKRSAIESEVAVPVLWSFLLAGSLAFVAALATLAAREITDAHWDWWLPLAVGGSTGVLVFAWRCIVCEGDRRALLLWQMEAALGIDLNQDGVIGEPVPSFEVEPAQPEGRPIYVRDANRERQRLQAGDFRYFLKYAYGETGTTWQAWDNVELPSGRLVSQPLWEQWTKRLQKAGLATRAYATAPLELCGDYRQALETFKNLL